MRRQRTYEEITSETEKLLSAYAQDMLFQENPSEKFLTKGRMLGIFRLWDILTAAYQPEEARNLLLKKILEANASQKGGASAQVAEKQPALTTPPSSYTVGTALETRILDAVQESLVEIIKKGEWLRLDYDNRIRADASVLRKAYDQVDMSKVLQLVAGGVEQIIADKILNSLATEVATDVKSILSNKELREDIRAVIRQKIRSVNLALT